MEKMYKVIHRIYEEVCSDPYYGKESRIANTYIIFAEETDVIKLVEDLNKKNYSRFPATDEEIKELKERYEKEKDEYEKQYLKWELDDLYDKDENYWLYREMQLDTIEKIRIYEFLD